MSFKKVEKGIDWEIKCMELLDLCLYTLFGF